MFEGHEFVKLVNNNWVLDLTENKGYAVKCDFKGKVKDYKLAFTVEVKDNTFNVVKEIKVPLKILKEAYNQINEYNKNIEVEP